MEKEEGKEEEVEEVVTGVVEEEKVAEEEEEGLSRFFLHSSEYISLVNTHVRNYYSGACLYIFEGLYSCSCTELRKKVRPNAMHGARYVSLDRFTRKLAL